MYSRECVLKSSPAVRAKRKDAFPRAARSAHGSEPVASCFDIPAARDGLSLPFSPPGLGQPAEAAPQRLLQLARAELSTLAAESRRQGLERLARQAELSITATDSNGQN